MFLLLLGGKYCFPNRLEEKNLQEVDQKAQSHILFKYHHCLNESACLAECAYEIELFSVPPQEALDT